MSARALLEELATLGVELRVGDTNNLEYEGPEEAVTPKVLDRLRRHKAELVRLLTEDCRTGQDARLDPATHKLLTAGWKSRERLGKTIWERPDNGFYVSEEVALILLDRQRANYQRQAYEQSEQILITPISQLERGGNN